MQIIVSRSPKGKKKKKPKEKKNLSPRTSWRRVALIAFLIFAFAATITIPYLWGAQNLRKGETGENLLTHDEAREEVSSSSDKDGEVVTSIPCSELYCARPPGTVSAQHIVGETQEVEGKHIDGEELEPAEEDISISMVKSSALGRDLGNSAKTRAYRVYQIVQTSMARPGQIYISAELELDKNRFQLQYIALQMALSTWVKEEKTKGRSTGQTGIHVKLQTGPLPGDSFYAVNVSAVDVTLGQILDILIKLEPVYNLLQDNCWFYAYAGTKAILELCIVNAFDDQSRKKLEEQLTELEERKPFMPKDFADMCLVVG